MRGAPGSTCEQPEEPLGPEVAPFRVTVLCGYLSPASSRAHLPLFPLDDPFSAPEKRVSGWGRVVELLGWCQSAGRRLFPSILCRKTPEQRVTGCPERPHRLRPAAVVWTTSSYIVRWCQGGHPWTAGRVWPWEEHRDLTSLALHERLPEILVLPREKTPTGAAAQGNP